MTTKRVTCALIAVMLLGIGTAHAVPKLAMPDTLFEFGYVPQNARIAHIFWLKSVGTDTLKVLRVTPGCGCTQTPIDKQELAPKDSTRLEIIFNTGNYSGAVVKTPRISVNDSTPERMIYFKANVTLRPDSTYPIVIAPYKLDISQFGEKTRSEISFTIKNEANQALTPSIISTASDYFEVQLPKTIEAGKTASGSIKLSKDGLTKEFEKSFTFQLNDERQSRFTVPVKRTMHSLENSSTAPATQATPASAH
jgi:hypothetical protein